MYGQVAAAMSRQDSAGQVLSADVGDPHPQRDAAMFDLFLAMVLVMLAHRARETCSDHGIGAAFDGTCGQRARI